MRVMVFLFVMMMFGGCAKYVETNVSVFHELKPPVQSSTFAFFPSPEQDGNLEFQTYAKLIKEELERYGLRESAHVDARYGIYLSYGMDQGREVFSSMPVYGYMGIGGFYGIGRNMHRPGLYTGVNVMAPMYGVVGTQTRTDKEYGSFLYVDIIDLGSGSKKQKVYEGRVSGKSDTPFLGATMPALVRSVFRDFPGESGMTRSAREPLEEKKQ